MLANQCRSRQYARIFPLKLSTNAFCVGLPGWMKCSFTPAFFAQKYIVFDVNSGPLSQTIVFGSFLGGRFCGGLDDLPGHGLAVIPDEGATGDRDHVVVPIDLDRRTRFTWTEELVFPWWLGGPIGALVGGRVVMGAIWRRNLRALAKIVESA